MSSDRRARRTKGEHEKLGFRTEGRLRQDDYRDGRYWDTIVMAVLRDEWPAVRDRLDARLAAV